MAEKEFPEIEEQNGKTIKDYTDPDFQRDEDDAKDFHVRGEEKLFDDIPGIDEKEINEEEMYNWGDEDDTPDSDKAWEDYNDPDEPL